jgi:hypothetical protein
MHECEHEHSPASPPMEYLQLLVGGTGEEGDIVDLGGEGSVKVLEDVVQMICVSAPTV